MSVTLKEDFDKIKGRCPLHIDGDCCRAKPNYASPVNGNIYYQLCVYKNCPFMFWFEMLIHVG